MAKVHKLKKSTSSSVAPEMSKEETAFLSEGTSAMGAVTDEEKLHEIVMQQSSFGTFPPCAILASLIGFSSVAEINEKLPQTMKAVSPEIWTTVLVCVFLEKRLAGEKEAWELVVEKAWAFVASIIGVEMIADLKLAAEGVVGA
jgi:hypothetical protein